MYLIILREINCQVFNSHKTFLSKKIFLITLQHLQKFQQREIKAHKEQRVEQIKGEEERDRKNEF